MIFTLKVVLSFIVGGLYIAGTTMLAEKVSPKIAGLLTGLPTTALISLSFLSWTSSLKEAGAAASIIPAIIAGSTIFLVVYVLLGERKLIIKFPIAISTWLINAVIFAYYRDFNALIPYSYSILIFLISMLILKRISHKNTKIIKFTKQEMLFRFIFSGAVIATSIILGKVSGTIWGAVFAAYPASFTSTFVILERHHGSKIIAAMAPTMTYGSVGTGTFALVFHLLSNKLNFALVLILAYLSALVCAYTLMQLRNIKREKKEIEIA